MKEHHPLQLHFHCANGCCSMIMCRRNSTGPILESWGMGAIFQQKAKEMLKKGKIFENLDKNVQNLKIF